MRSISIQAPKAGGIRAAVEGPRKDDVLRAAGRKSEDSSCRIPGEHRMVFPVRVGADQMRGVGCQQIPVGTPIERKDVFSVDRQRTNRTRRAALSRKNEEILYSLLLHRSESLAIGGKTQRGITIRIARDSAK